MSGTNAHGVPSLKSHFDSEVRLAVTSTWFKRDRPVGAMIRPPTFVCSIHGFGILGAPAVAITQSYGERGG